MRFGRRKPDATSGKSAVYQEPTSDESVDALLDYFGKMAIRARDAHKPASGNADKSASSIPTNPADDDATAGPA
jgi:hypothetical protein